MKKKSIWIILLAIVLLAILSTYLIHTHHVSQYNKQEEKILEDIEQHIKLSDITRKEKEEINLRLEAHEEAVGSDDEWIYVTTFGSDEVNIEELKKAISIVNGGKSDCIINVSFISYYTEENSKKMDYNYMKYLFFDYSDTSLDVYVNEAVMEKSNKLNTSGTAHAGWNLEFIYEDESRVEHSAQKYYDFLLECSKSNYQTLSYFSRILTEVLERFDADIINILGYAIMDAQNDFEMNGKKWGNPYDVPSGNKEAFIELLYNLNILRRPV